LGRYSVLILFDTYTLVPEYDSVVSQSILDRSKKRRMKVRSMDGDLWPLVAGVPSSWLRVNQLPVPREKAEFSRLNPLLN
jgi:hypothetical protein